MSDVFLEVNGILYEGFESISFSKNMEELSGSFTFKISTKEKEYTPFKGQEKCVIKIKDKPFITGYIESLQYSYDENSHYIIASGRDKTCDIIDNNILGNIDWRGSVSLVQIIKNILGQIDGLLYSTNNPDGIKIINNAGSIEKFQFGSITGIGNLKVDKRVPASVLISNSNISEDDFNFEANESIVSKVGENMFDFIEKLCRKRSILLSSDGDGNIVLSRSSNLKISPEAIILNKIGNNNNNVISASINYDFSSRYYKYRCKSQGNASSLEAINDDSGAGLNTLDGTGITGETLDPDIRKTRVLEFENETSSISSSNLNRAIWESNIRRARSLVYNCTLNNLFADEEKTVFYVPNKTITVLDDFCDITSIMLIRSVSYEVSDSAGTLVNLELVPYDAYTDQKIESSTDEKYNKLGESVKIEELTEKQKQAIDALEKYRLENLMPI